MKLREIRKKINLTQIEISKKIGVSFQTYSSWETGRTQPSFDMLCKLADFFDVTVDELLGREQGQQLFDDARVERPEIFDVYEKLTPEQQANLLNYARGMATANELAGAPAQTQKRTDIA